MMNLHEIVADWLREHGYDGLVRIDYECGCGLDDLMPCSQPSEHCEAAYRRECVDCPDDTDCELQDGYRPGCWHLDKLGGPDADPNRSCSTCRWWEKLCSQRYCEPWPCSGCFGNPEHPKWEADHECAEEALDAALAALGEGES